MKYPEWSPDVLRDLHVKVLEQCEQLDRSVSQFASDLERKRKELGMVAMPKPERFVSILEKMITQSDMKAVWKSLHRHGARDDDLVDFAYLTHHASLGPTEWEKKTRTHQREHVKHIMKTAHSLADLLEQTPFDHSPYRFLDDQQAQQLLSVLDPDFISKKRYPDDAQHLGAMLDYPRMSGLLRNLVLKVHVMAQEIGNEKPILPNPNIKEAKRARRIYFIRHLSRHLHRRYNTPLHSVVAATAQTVLGGEINEDTVRAVVRNHTP